MKILSGGVTRLAVLPAFPTICRHQDVQLVTSHKKRGVQVNAWVTATGRIERDGLPMVAASEELTRILDAASSWSMLKCRFLHILIVYVEYIDHGVFCIKHRDAGMAVGIEADLREAEAMSKAKGLTPDPMEVLVCDLCATAVCWSLAERGAATPVHLKDYKEKWGRLRHQMRADYWPQ